MTQSIPFELEAVEAADNFVELFTNFMDKSRQTVTKFYVEESCLCWDGNIVKGLEPISRFYNSLPTTNHIVMAFDAQPLAPSVVAQTPGQPPSIVIAMAGLVEFTQAGSKSNFNRSIILIPAQGDQLKPGSSWKVLSDTMRLQQVDKFRSAK